MWTLQYKTLWGEGDLQILWNGHIRKCLNNLLAVNIVGTQVESDKELVEMIICRDKSIICITGLCERCKDFKKLDSLKIYYLHCSNQCKEEGNAWLAEGYTIKISIFEETKYMYHQKEGDVSRQTC